VHYIPYIGIVSSVLPVITIVLVTLLGQASAAEPFPRFLDVATSVGVTRMNRSGDADKDYILEVNGNGAAFFDYDNDGDVDLLIVNGSTLKGYAMGGDSMAALYDNQGDRFVDVTDTAGLTRRGWGMGACVADYDNDGHSDVYLTAYGANVLYGNNGDGTFEDRTSEAVVGDARWSTNCAFGDFDRDGHVDLYVANYLRFDGSVPARGESSSCRFMGFDVMCGPVGLSGQSDVLYYNNGDGTFSDVSNFVGIAQNAYYGFGVVFTDLDNDAWPDIYVANDSVPNLLFRNRQDRTFVEIGLISGASLNGGGVAEAGMGVAVGDYDADGLEDLFVTNFARETNTLYRNRGNMVFEDVTSAAGLGQGSIPHVGWGTSFADLDNDGLLDLVVANGHVYPRVDDWGAGQTFRQRKEIYQNLGHGRFREVVPVPGGDLLEGRSSRGLAVADFDNDGDVDIAVVNLNEPPSLYLNEGGNLGAWVSFDLEGTDSNRDAIGARVDIEAGGRKQVAMVRSGGSYLSHNDMRIHFGIGTADRIDRVRILWPSGRVDWFHDLPAGRFVRIREGRGIVGSYSPAAP
jgi:hypothetical protein